MQYAGSWEITQSERDRLGGIGNTSEKFLRPISKLLRRMLLASWTSFSYDTQRRVLWFLQEKFLGVCST